MKVMDATQKAVLVNVAVLSGLVIEALRGAPWFAVALTAAVVLPMANGLMYWKQQQRMRGKA